MTVVRWILKRSASSLVEAAGRSLLEQLVNLWGSEAGLFSHDRATLCGAGTALSIIFRGRNAVT
jgi:hypothetical protein